MIIPINNLTTTPRVGSGLPPVLAQLGSSELVLLELQGDLEVEGDRNGQTVGKLTVDDGLKVCYLLPHWFFTQRIAQGQAYASYWSPFTRGQGGFTC